MRARLLWLAALCAAGSVLAATDTGPGRAIPDTIAQRVQACTVCHGKEGRATNSGYFPRIAGKPAGYLHNQLLNFREGRRYNEGMTGLLDTLTDAYLWEIAEHFAAIDLPYPPPQPTQLGQSELERARRLVRQGDTALGVPACETCHGKALTGRQPAFPGLLGLPRDYLAAQLGAWKTGQRRAAEPDCMADIARRLPDSDVSVLAHWLAAQPVVPVVSAPTRRSRADAATSQRPAELPMRCGSGPR